MSIKGRIFGTVVGGPFTFTDRGFHELKRVPGAREVKTLGGPGRVVQVELDPSRLRERGVDRVAFEDPGYDETGRLAGARRGRTSGFGHRRQTRAEWCGSVVHDAR